MTKQEAWVRFMAGALASAMPETVKDAAHEADEALEEYVKRWPDSPGLYPKRAEDGATREG